MAKKILLKNPATGITKNGFYGFSWTTFFFGGFPALFRGDYMIGLIFIVLSILTAGVAGFIFAFSYNRRYTTKLLEEGYRFAGSEAENAAAAAKLGVDLSATAVPQAA
ncbi:MAG TPA: hypothetical protein PLV07_10665 [Acidiphilium sp.]|jgi:uncharacterized membrane protein|uniref:hypothetical protein n=1 Tax=unclassified Acidiphilium TaxID=2617493 RepID=UPI000BC98CA7|nr:MULTISPECIES: hypothetical protein [unclassified Acidiphilium]OYV57043.1 MAG: hypothetical protein B7Z76_03780 [Acidiphilium sp. 20-67-58]HQT61788.1 hypothetical protein [Acidiphilium sp.]HQU12033.1 hypothetical protein [Acidiphilium sp.]